MIPSYHFVCVKLLLLTGPTHHTFTVTVSGVRGLSVFSSTVWGEADCFVQYHFPSVSDKPPGGREREEGGLLPVPEVALEPVRTNLTLCVPNPTFSHEVSHSLSLPPDCLVQREMMRACGNSGGVVFELWRRFYYPNIRDHLIAKAIHLVCHIHLHHIMYVHLHTL